VIDHRDLDRPTAEALVHAGVVAVVNAQPMFSGRYANLGPTVLSEAGIVIVDGIGSSAYARLADNPGEVRLHEGSVYAGADLVVAGREVCAEHIRAEMEGAGAGLAAHIETFTRNSTELIRRDLDLLLEGEGLPPMPSALQGRPTIVVGQAHPAEIVHLRSFVSQERPAVIAVDAAADRLRAHHIQADVIVISESDRLPASRVLKGAAVVVLVNDAGTSTEAAEALGRTGVDALVVRTQAGGDDVAVLIAAALDATLVIGAGLPSSLADFLDRQRPGLAGAFLARLAVGGRYVDAAAVPLLYTGRVRPWHVVTLGCVGVVGLGLAIAATPIGQAWLDTVQGWF
jgi:uncharacterized membrane-anchored protein